MRVAFVYWSDLSVPSGVRAHVRNSSDALDLEGHETLVLAPGWLDQSTRGQGIRVPVNGSVSRVPITIPKKDWLAALAEFKADVIEFQGPIVPALRSLTRRDLAPLQVLMIHSSFYKRPLAPMRHLYRRLVRIGCGEFDKLYTAGEPGRADWEDAYGRRLDAALPVVWDNENEVSSPAPPKTYDICLLGDLVPRKGMALALRAIAQASESVGDLRVAIAGDGPSEGALRTLSASLPNVEVEFLGRVSDADRDAMLRASRVALFASLGGEAFGYALVDALRAEVPIVASDIWAYRELLSREHPGLADANEKSMSQKLSFFINDSAARGRAVALGAKRLELLARLSRTQMRDRLSLPGLSASSDAVTSTPNLITRSDLRVTL